MSISQQPHTSECEVPEQLLAGEKNAPRVTLRKEYSGCEYDITATSLLRAATRTTIMTQLRP